jgi:putative membrane protein
MPTRNRHLALRCGAVLTGATVLAQILYPLLHGSGRDSLTIAIVLLAAAAALSHSYGSVGRIGPVALVIAAGLAFGAEVVGVHTGWPFGRYGYARTLGPVVLGVPILIAAAWIMMAWPAALAARRLATRPVRRWLVGAWALASWDLFLDPQMVAARHWTWAGHDPHLPGVPGVPVTNFLGWAALALAVAAVLQVPLRGTAPVDDAAPIAFYLWTYFGSILAFTVWLDLAGAALWGALGMGVVAVPLLVRLARTRHGALPLARSPRGASPLVGPGRAAR